MIYDRAFPLTDILNDHHGGGLWLWEGDSPDFGQPFMVKNLAGAEWSSQFCAAPERMDLLRQNAAKLYALFPRSVAKLDEMGCNATELLATPIVDAATVADWVDSIFNASVPLPASAHTGVLPASGGLHHYPQPICDIEFFKRDDFQLWVDDGTGVKIAVVPVAPHGSGVAEIAVAYAPLTSVLHPAYAAVREKGELLVLPPDHPIAQAAFAKQT